MLTAPPRGPTPGARLLSGAEVEYRVTYLVLPAGVGPDDYESADLERREDIVDLPDPGNGYGPAMPDVQDALSDMLPDGARPIAVKFLD